MADNAPTTAQAAASNKTASSDAVKDELAKVEAEKKEGADVEKAQSAPAERQYKSNEYKVVHGKHFVGLDSNGNAKYARKGDIVELTPSQAKNFANKFVKA